MILMTFDDLYFTYWLLHASVTMSRFVAKEKPASG
jgi:hypothetical protein